MRTTVVAGAALALALSIGSATHDGAVASDNLQAEGRNDLPYDVHLTRRDLRQWAPREYWQWDHRPIWDDPWAVLRPNFWGSPEPHLVPADIWACKWHLPSWRDWRWHRRQCGAWRKAWRAR